MRHLGIACGGDDAYATGIAVALYSALSCLSAEVSRPCTSLMVASPPITARAGARDHWGATGFLHCLVPHFRL